jgi:two-component system sensor histidine kinase ChiS
MNTNLEQQVVDRTAELAFANHSLAESNSILRQQTADLLELTAALERFFPREFLNLIGKHDMKTLHLGDQVQREMTVMFADIRDFTSLSESMTPQQNFNFINGFFGRVGPSIRQNGGFIDQYIGDAIMALFPHQTDDAIRAALELIKATTRYNEERRRARYRLLTVGIAIHTGDLVAGIIGEEHRLQGTVISDVVNATARLEKLTKLYGAQVIVSEETCNQLQHPDRYQYRFLDRVYVEGKQQPISVFEVLDSYTPETQHLRLHTRATFEQGIQHYCCHEFDAALACFESVLAIDATDKAAHLYYTRSAERHVVH